jgi:hypothetical protein
MFLHKQLVSNESLAKVLKSQFPYTTLGEVSKKMSPEDMFEYFFIDLWHFFLLSIVAMKLDLVFYSEYM